tara:strand:- start:65 stop:247 length:183 start_codon:yes stop_codon:yes gene_type:complete
MVAVEVVEIKDQPQVQVVLVVVEMVAYPLVDNKLEQLILAAVAVETDLALELVVMVDQVL